MAKADATRSHVQKALCLVCDEPRYGELKHRLRGAAAAFFGQSEVFETAVLKTVHASLSHAMRLSKQPLDWGLGCARLVKAIGAASTLRALKCVLVERSVVFVNEKSLSAAADAALALASLVPGLLDAAAHRALETGTTGTGTGVPSANPFFDEDEDDRPDCLAQRTDTRDAI